MATTSAWMTRCTLLSGRVDIALPPIAAFSATAPALFTAGGASAPGTWPPDVGNLLELASNTARRIPPQRFIAALHFIGGIIGWAAAATPFSSEPEPA